MKILAFGCAFLIFVAVICSSTIRAANSGSALYRFRCAHCHADDGSGNTEARKKMKVPDLREKKYIDMSDQELFDSIGHGKNHKEYPHAFLHTGMNDDDVSQIIAHLRTLQKK